MKYFVSFKVKLAFTFFVVVVKTNFLLKGHWTLSYHYEDLWSSQKSKTRIVCFHNVYNGALEDSSTQENQESCWKVMLWDSLHYKMYCVYFIEPILYLQYCKFP